MELRTNLAEEFKGVSKSIAYPYILIPKFGNELALLVKAIQPGTVPIIVKHNGKLTQVHSCMLSAIELSKLNRVYKYEVVLSPTESHTMMGIQDIMEVIPWMLSLSSSPQ